MNNIKHNIKLVIWDLDETFWEGTLSEEGITVIHENIKLVKELSSRGIVNSICSKNDYNTVKEKLTELDVWDYFVFPSISWSAKGPAVEQILKQMSLRPENTLFIDDNHHNLAEVSATCKNINAIHPDAIDEIKHSHYLAGKLDSKHTRLSQYKILQQKHTALNTSSLSNDDFLRSSNIQIKIDHDVMSNIDRVFELIERTNQLNYTKQRLFSEKDKQEFVSSIERHNMSSALIYASDSYGDYGLIGFYQLKTTKSTKTLLHFVFSCRIMNMGIETYVYNRLGKPNFRITGPVAYPIKHKEIDWITESNSIRQDTDDTVDDNILILGPCSTLQLSVIMGNCKEYVHHSSPTGQVIKYECPGFFLSSEDDVRDSKVLEGHDFWHKDDFFKFREDLVKADKVVLDLADMLRPYRTQTIGNITLRDTINKNESYSEKLDEFPKKVEWLKQSLDFIFVNTKPTSNIYLLDRIINTSASYARGMRLAYRQIILETALKYSNAILVNPHSFYDKALYSDDGGHLNRSAIIQMAKFILSGRTDTDTTVDYTVYITR